MEEITSYLFPGFCCYFPLALYSLIYSSFQQTFLSLWKAFLTHPSQQPIAWCFCCFLGIPLELFLVRVVGENQGKIRRTAWLLKRKEPDCLGGCWKASKISDGRRIKVCWEGRRRALCTQKLLGLKENERSQCDGNKGTLVHSQSGACRGNEQPWP